MLSLQGRCLSLQSLSEGLQNPSLQQASLGTLRIRLDLPEGVLHTSSSEIAEALVALLYLKEQLNPLERNFLYASIAKWQLLDLHMAQIAHRSSWSLLIQSLLESSDCERLRQENLEEEDPDPPLLDG